MITEKERYTIQKAKRLWYGVFFAVLEGLDYTVFELR